MVRAQLMVHSGTNDVGGHLTEKVVSAAARFETKVAVRPPGHLPA